MKSQTKSFVTSAQLSASTMMWSMDVDVTMTSKKKLKLVLVENSEAGRTESDTWKFIDPPYDFISQVGKYFIEASDWRISGHVPVHVTTGTEVDSAYLSMCWCDTGLDSTAKLLTKLSPDLRGSIHALFAGFEGIELNSIAEPIVAEIIPYGDWEDIIERFGEPSDLAWWEETSATLKTEQVQKKEAFAQAETARIKRDFGTPEMVGDFENLIKKFGDKIPVGYLLHLTAFDAPDPGEISDIFLMAWGKQKKPIPGHSGIGRHFLGGGDLNFATWLLSSSKSEKLSRLRDRKEVHAKEVFRKLKRIADKGRIGVENKPSSQGGAMAWRYAKLAVSLDPDIDADEV